MTRNSNPDYLNGVPELVVLQLLARRSMYGYELLRAIEQSTGEVLKFGEGCIYPVLHRLDEEGSLRSRRETVGGRSRVVYQLTTSGHKRLACRIAAWRSIAGAVGQVLLGDKDGRPAIA
jgi:PadR family transcriptional regulator, regulatory protein PadR